MAETDTPAEGFGDLDGEVIALISLNLSGAAGVDRLYAPGERVVLIVEGEVADGVTVKRTAGHLHRIHKLKVTAAAPPGDQLAGEVEDFLKAFVDEREGKTPLPFPDDTPDAGDADPGFVSDSRPEPEEPAEDDQP